MRNMLKDYLPVWGIITIALIFFMALSFSGIDALLGENFRIATFKEQLTAEPEVALIDTLPVDTTMATRQVVKVDSDSQRILIFGDSMLDGLNPRLAAYAKSNGHELYSVIWYSSTVKQWGSCEKLKGYIERFKPTFIFISLGGNELFVKDIVTKRKANVDSILSQIGDIPYLWIGPPNWKPDTGINDLISKSVKPGCFFLSNGMTFERKDDGAHPTTASSALWLDSVVRWMPHNASHPIKLDLPEKGFKARPDEVVVLKPEN